MMENIVKQLAKQEKEPNDYALVILQLVAVQFEIYFKALDDVIRDGIVNSTQVGDRTINQPKPQLEALQKSNTQITRLLDKIGISPLEAAKIKKLNKSDDDESGKELLNSLICE